MNPDNNSLSRTFFIGGPPRVGKTTLAYLLAKEINGHVVSTDAIRNAVKKAYSKKTGPLFMINDYNKLGDEELIKRFKFSPHLVVDDQVAESEVLFPSITSFCNAFCEDKEHHIVEGVALVPKLIAKMEYPPKHIIFIGNTSQHLAENMITYGKLHPSVCWMSALGYGEEKIRAYGVYINELSNYFKTEAEKYNYSYIEMSESSHETSLQDVLKKLLKKS